MSRCPWKFPACWDGGLAVGLALATIAVLYAPAGRQSRADDTAASTSQSEAAEKGRQDGEPSDPAGESQPAPAEDRANPAPKAAPKAADAGDDPEAPSAAAEPAGQLPWSSRDIQKSPPRSPREMLELFDIGESQLRSLFDGQPLGEPDEETLVKLLFRFPRMGEENIYRWRQELPLDELAENPAEHRAEVISMEGRVTRIEQRPVIAELARLYSFDRYWMLTIEPDEGQYDVIVCTRQIPAAWGDEPLDEASFRVQLDAFFLKVGASQPRQQLVFAASQVRWRPAEPDPRRGVTPSHVLLAQHGMDVGHIAELPEQNGRPLNAYDREAFYDMLAAARDIPDQQIDQFGVPPADLSKLLVQPELIHGELMSVRVRAARITRVEVEGKDIQDRFGIDSYYYIDAYLPLGEQSVRLGDEENSPQYQNSFPTTICLIDLPEEMKDIHQRMAAGESPTELFDRELEVDGFFFKIWSYRSEFIDEKTPGKLQPAPMLLAARMRLLRPGGVSADALSVVFGVGFLVLLGAVSLTLWLTGRRDQAYERQQQDKRFALSQPLDRLDVPAAGPDFSSLAPQERSAGQEAESAESATDGEDARERREGP